MNVAVTGYYNTGSSAVLDLLQEYQHVSMVPAIDRQYEHVVFYTSGGLFDLCTLLTHGNSPHTSDMVINHFVQAMKRLNDYDMVWFGSMKKLFGDRFTTLVDDFVNEISTSKKGETSEHIISSHYSLIKAAVQFALKIIQHRPVVQYGRAYKRDGWPVYFSMPDEDTLFTAVKRFTKGYFSLFDTDADIALKLFDHLIWPQQIDEFSRCFDDDMKFIILDRDPRDLFLISKYNSWRLNHAKPHYPTDPHVFVEEWKRTHVASFSNPNAVQLHFEELIYDYDNAVEKVESFLGLKNEWHIEKGKHLQPEKSIENTQLFQLNDDWHKEVKVIEDQLGDFLYSFPYERKPNYNLMFAK